MGKINQDVLNTHLRIHPTQKYFLDTFLFHFDINHGKLLSSSKTVISCYLMSPDRDMKSTFGFSDEILLVYSDFDRLEPRTIQAIEDVYGQQPFRSRANPLTFFLVTNDVRGADWVQSYLVDHPQFRTPIVMTRIEAESKSFDGGFVRNRLSNQLFGRDVFDYQLPLDRDMYFFGREDIFNSLVDSVRKSQNKGLYGLRKTGKTSLLFKLKRTLETTKIATCIYIDCKRPDIRRKKWEDFIEYLCDQLLVALNRNRESFKKVSGAERLIEILKFVAGNKQVCFILDEIEYISPLAVLDRHWNEDFVDLWQTLWSIQSEYRKCSFIIAGVNPYVSEIDIINRVQNPMFGIVQGTMLTGLGRDELHAMVSRIGRQMGLLFTADALDYLHTRYGGHPLLTRMACSLLNREVIIEEKQRPFEVTEKYLSSGQKEREGELHFYCRHIVSELKEFYPDEYQMLKMLAEGNVADFFELSAEPEYVKHLKGYGILNKSTGDRPSFRIPVLQRYIANESAREEGRRDPRTAKPKDMRPLWLEQRKQSIIQEFRQFFKVIEERGLESPYHSFFLPEANRISEISLVDNWSEFSSFINGINMCLVETIDNVKGSKYFFNKMKSEFPPLFGSLNRIRVYRNNADHLRLNRNVDSVFNQYIRVDLMDKPLREYQEPGFILQQVVLDELFVSLQVEINKIS